MIQLVDSIRCTLVANVEVNHVVTMLACECKTRDSTIFYETQAQCMYEERYRFGDGILSQNDTQEYVWKESHVLMQQIIQIRFLQSSFNS